MNYFRAVAEQAHQRFESLVKEVVERRMGCDTWAGLAGGRLRCVAGVFLVDDVPVCKATPVRFEDGCFKFEFEDLTGGAKP